MEPGEGSQTMNEGPLTTLARGTSLGPYRIDALIGAGGMGEVFRATDTRLDRPVAIKKTHHEFSDRFEREARAISALNHPHICTLYDVGSDYLVMELVEGDTLASLIRRGPIPLERALEYAIQIADALAAAHAAGVVHRDLKPGNIIVTRNGVKVLDFGLAKLQGAVGPRGSAATGIAARSEPVTSAGTVLGTPHYMAPEQVEGRDADERSDIFAFGVVLYEMITGRRAFDGDTDVSVAAAILKDQPAPMSELRARVPRAFERVVRRCIEKRPDDRWQSARDLKPALELIDLDAISGVSGSGVQPAIAARTRRPWPWLVTAAVLAAAVLGAAVWLRPPAEPRPVTRFTTPLPPGVEVGANNLYVRLSPDGTKIALVIGRALWVRDLAGDIEARELPGTEGATAPFWSPDSRSVAFGQGQRLMRVDLAGGSARLLAESAVPVGSGFWTEDGEIVFGSRGDGPGLQRVPDSGGVPQPLTFTAEGEAFHALPSLLPDGRRFLYLRTGSDAVQGMYVGSLDLTPNDQPKERVLPALVAATVVRSNHPAGARVLFMSGGTLMTQPFDTRALRLVGEPQVVAEQVGTGGSHAHFSATPDVVAYRVGERYDQSLLARALWVDREGDIAGGAGVAGGPIVSLALSPDERHVVLQRRYAPGSPESDLWMADLTDDDSEWTFTLSRDV